MPLIHTLKLDTITLNAFKGEFLHKAMEYKNKYGSISVIRCHIMNIFYDIHFGNTYYYVDQTFMHQLFYIAIMLESINLSRMMGTTNKLECTDISQALLGIAVGAQSPKSEWMQVMKNYYSLVSIDSVKKLLAAVPQNPQNETFQEDKIYETLKEQLILLDHGTLILLNRQIGSFLKNIAVSYENKLLNDEGYWEMHTRIQKFLLVWLAITIYINNHENKLYMARIETKLDISAMLSVVNVTFADQLWQQMIDLRQPMGIFHDLSETHKSRASIRPAIVHLFTNFPTIFDAIKCQHLLTS